MCLYYLSDMCDLMGDNVAKNTGDGFRRGMAKSRAQLLNPVTGRYVKIDTQTGRVIDQKRTDGPYKGIRDVSASA